MEEGKFELWAQVRTGTPQMKVDNEGMLRPNGWPEGGSLVFLGDVTQAILSSLGPHSPPEFIERPGFDEQRWTISVQSNELKILIRSESYWGFGLFARCYLNKIEIIGLNLNERNKIESIINDANFKNIFNLDKQYLKEKIDTINIIEHFEIFKNYPSTLKIFVKETKILAQTKKNSSNYFIGSNGKLILNRIYL